MATAQAGVAVFLDFENLVLSAQAEQPALGREAVPDAALRALCLQDGNAGIRRAYADWGRPAFAVHQEVLALSGVDLVQVKRFGLCQKNAADVRLAVDAMETLITHPDVSTFVLVAGDGDYSPLVQRLREYGRTVVGVSTRASASPRLVAVCSEYRYWGSLVAEAAPPPQAGPALRGVVEVLLRAIDGTPGRTAGGWAAAGPLKNRILSLQPDFDQTDYGAKTFTAFLALPQLQDVVELRRLDGGQPLVRRRPRRQRAA